MSILSNTALKALFETGDKPTEGNFADFIDTVWTIYPIGGGTGELTEAANIAINCESYQQTMAFIKAMERVATTLTFSNFGKIFGLSMTKNNTDQGLVFTLAGANLVFDVFDPTNKVFTRATTVTIAGTDSDQSWSLIFDDTGILSGANKIIQVTGSISSFA